MALKVEARGAAMIEKMRELKAAGCLITGWEVGKTNADWIITYHEKSPESPPPAQFELAI